MSEGKRAYLYRVAAAAAPLAVCYGLIAENASGLWLGLAGALLGSAGNTLASRHTPPEGR